jgi:hypothetical protein
MSSGTKANALSFRLYLFAFFRKIHFSLLKFVYQLTLKEK